MIRRARGGAAIASMATLTTTKRDDAAELGRNARRDAPRSAHAEFTPAADRVDPLALLEAESASRLPDLVPIRYGRMLGSPFAFFRGAAAIMAADLARSPTSGLEAQLCGDAHLSNFGLFAAPDRRLVFDVNDFDETHRGPWEWDVKRLGASIEIAGRARGFPPKQRRAAVLGAVGRYRVAMRTFADMGHLDVWYSRLDTPTARAVFPDQVREGARTTRKVTTKARRKDSLRALSRLAGVVDGRLQILSDPPLVRRIDEVMPAADAGELHEAMCRLLDMYAESLPDDRRHLLSGYRVVDMARKVVGVGSVGTRAWILLLVGRDERDPLVLQAKEAEESVLGKHLAPSPYANHGQRVVQGQRLMQAASDIMLGWLRADGIDGVSRDFYLRQLWDGKGSFEIETMSPAILARYAEVCGWTLARAHARSGDRVAIAAYLGSGDAFDRAIVEFSARYGDCNEADFHAVERAADDGRIPVQVG
jgi:uncharacterized protein (DUF2252 family)